MTSHYTTTYLVLCIFITSATAHSFIRQVTDDFNTNLQPEVGGAGPIQNLDVAHYLHKDQEIKTRDHKVSSRVWGLRNRPPSSYSLKLESFYYLLNSTDVKYESRPFTVGGYNWTLVVYPNENNGDHDTGEGYLSLYVAIDNSTLVAAHQEIYADVTFYIYNRNVRKYLAIQDSDVWKFSASQTMRGFANVATVHIFKDPRNGYLYDGDHCEFGVDVTIPSLYDKSELFSVTENFHNPRFTWTIRGFSTLLNESNLSDVFTIGERSWNIQVNPNGYGTGEGEGDGAMSMYLNLNVNGTFRPYENIYVRAKLRVLNNFNPSHIERQLDNWYGYGLSSRGYDEFISFADLRDKSKGYLVNDILRVEVYMEAISSTKYTNLQPEVGAAPIQNLDVAHYLHKNQEISSRDYKVSVPYPHKAVRNRPPSSYSLKFESFNYLLNSTYAEKYETRPFAVGGYNWTLVVYPKGTAPGFLSLYVAIDNSTLVPHQEIYADLRFYIYNKNERNYLTIQETDIWKFTASDTMCGFARPLSNYTFKDPRSGYLYDGDHCEFGVDVTIRSLYEESEVFSVTEYTNNPRFTWTIRGFSTLLNDSYLSNVFTIGERSWNIQVFPYGHATGEGKALSMYLNLNVNETYRPYDKIYVRAKLLVLNQFNLNNVERKLDNWYNAPGYGVSSWGDHEFISLADLRDLSKGFVVNDVLKVQVEMEAISSTKYFPN